MPTNILTHTGNRILIKFDGKSIGLLQSLNWTDAYAPDDASGIGDIHVQEHVPSVARHEITVSTMVLKKASLISKGIYMEKGGKGKGDSASEPATMLSGKVFDIEAYDKDSGDLLKKWEACTFVSGSGTIEKHRIVMINSVFKALDTSGKFVSSYGNAPVLTD